MTPTIEQQFIESFNFLAGFAHGNSREKGFWDKKDWMTEHCELHGGPGSEFAASTIISQELMLIVSELAEAMEAVRHGNPPDDKVPEFSGLEAEIADVLIRVMDMASGRNLRIAEAVISKMKMNQGREKMHGGKQF